MGKKKNKNKVSGAVKTATKTEKKLANKLKKELANLGEEDIAKVIAEIEREEAKRTTAKEKVLEAPPSPRAYASLTPHPTTNELVLFGGEYHNGQKTEVYNDLLLFNPSNNSWRRVKAPGAPPPRSAHQAVAVSANKGELWVFGGEFTSPSETQFHHYKDLWCFSFAEKKWEKVSRPGGPCARSGHRMSACGRRLVVFGGYSDDGRECRYFSDVYVFCLRSRLWTKLEPAGRAPLPRSACLMFPVDNHSIVVYGGFSRIREGRSERGHTHSDMFRLTLPPETEADDEASASASASASAATGAAGSGKCSWRSAGAGRAPAPRAGQAGAVVTHNNKAYVFGGITDAEETEEDVVGEVSDDLHSLDLASGSWRRVIVRAKAASEPANTEQETQPPPEEKPAEIVKVVDEVFTVRVGGATTTTDNKQHQSKETEASVSGPSARMSAMCAAHRATLFVYGGVLERDDKQFYLSDMYSLDLHKLNEWKTIIEQPPLPDWLGSSDDDDDDDSGSDEDDSEDDDE